jgi:hypothetical protein
MSSALETHVVTPGRALLDRLNGPWHRDALLALLVVTLAHWLEHIFQAIQIFLLGWPRATALGALGLVFPALVSSEWLHYLYAFVMLLGLLILRPGFRGRAAAWWNAALLIQVWHHFEHALLLGQALIGKNLFGSPVPTSILQLFLPRVELHLTYNLLVFVPMAVAMVLHRRDGGAVCTCAGTSTARPARFVRSSPAAPA